jgi:hypothetical protein
MDDPVQALTEQFSRLPDGVRTQTLSHLARVVTRRYAHGDRAWPSGLDGFISAANAAVGRENPAGGPITAGMALFLRAVGFLLRDRRDGDASRTAGEDKTGGDRAAAARHLAEAARRIPPDHPAAGIVVEMVGAVLDSERPLSGPVADVSEIFAGYAAEIRPAQVVVTAIGTLCRTVLALRRGEVPDRDALPHAVQAVPVNCPWHPVLATAATHATLAWAVRAGDLAAARDAARAIGESPLAALLVALVSDDVGGLRAALDRLAEVPSPRLTAVAGAARLLLADRTAGTGDADLDAAIAQLAHGAGELDDVHDPELRTRSWWRLAAAYRQRGAAGDGERSREAGCRALLGGGQDAAPAARFAGWMLAEGRAAEAFTALEVAGTAPAPSTGLGSLAGDIAAVLLGIGAPAGPAAPTYTREEVAGALRELGAAAVLYLHPTADSTRTVGVLCLDTTTDRLDVVANVPVTDPVESDDPSWPAIVDRWANRGDRSAGRPWVMVAATGELTGIALPAVRTGSGHRLAEDVVISHVGSGSELVRLARRPVRPVGEEPVFVVNPTGDRDPETADMLVVRRLFYPRSVCLGRATEPVDGAGTREEVLARLPDASLVHLACGVTPAGFQLAGGDRLDAATLRALPTANRGGLAIIAESTRGAFAALSGPLLDAGFSGVIGWLRPVDPRFAALALFMVHDMLVDQRFAPAYAVSAAQRWMLDTCRVVPTYLPAVHATIVETTDLRGPSLWALAYRGR